MTVTIGKVPVRSTVVRRATALDFLGSATRVLLFQPEYGCPFWMHIDGRIEWLESGAELGTFAQNGRQNGLQN